MTPFWMHKIMATLTLKNVPDILYQNLKKQALLNHRSLNNEAIVSLALVVNGNSASAQNILLNARALRVKENTTIHLTDDIINNAKQQGRL
jgi:plasmid stability protein